MQSAADTAPPVVVEDVSGWLRVMSDGTVDRAWTGNDSVSALIARVPPSGDGVFVDGVATRDIVIDPDKKLWLRIYLPETLPSLSSETKSPVIIHFHGGGFCISHADWRLYYHFYARLAKQCQMIVVSPNFRLAPEHRLPAAIDDAVDCLRWIDAVGTGEVQDTWLSPYADVARCALIGDSSGANIVHEVARWALNEGSGGGPLALRSVKVKAAVLLHPGFVNQERCKSELEMPADSAMLTLEMVDSFLGLSAPEGVSGRFHVFSNPVRAEGAVPLDSVRFPAMLVAIADMDLLRDSEMEYVEAMRDAGHDVEMVVSEKTGHCFHLNEIAISLDSLVSFETERLLASVKRFLVAKVK